MSTCRYCHSEYQGDRCPFCDARAELQKEKHPYSEFAPADYATRSIEFLERLHTFTLFLLLREVRRERSWDFDTIG